MWLTERDNNTWCVGRILGLAAGIELMVKFGMSSDTAWLAFAGAVAAIITAIAVKNISEKP